DEGLYMAMHRPFDEIIDHMQFGSPAEILEVLKYTFYMSLTGGKPLWVFLVHLRSFLGHFEDFYYAKILAAIFGILTLFVSYKFSERYFKSREIALVSV